MEAKCSRWKDCLSFKRNENCHGCSFQHFEKILDGHKDNKTLKFLGNQYFDLISKRRKGIGGRIALDKPIEELFLSSFPELEPLDSKKVRIKLDDDEEDFEVKADGAFQAHNTYIFYEVKGYGDNTNDILSAITAAQLLKEVPKFKDSYYYYIGAMTSISPYGLERKDFFDEKRTKVAPYVKWAEGKKFLKFYGIVDIELLIKEVGSKLVHEPSQRAVMRYAR